MSRTHKVSKKVQKTKSSESLQNIDINHISYNSVAAGFLGIALFQCMVVIYASMNGNIDKAFGNSIGCTVCLIAGLHYIWIRTNYINKSQVIIGTRYSDWYVTTVLMIIEFFVLSNTLKSSWGWLVASCILNEAMLVCGNISAIKKINKNKYIWVFLFGNLCGILLMITLLLGTLYDNTPHPNSWMYIFVASWVLYPVAFFASSDLYYNILDLFSKGVFGLSLGIITFVRDQ